ncbi:hypothetical protein KCP69_26515 (plasmid) [Salmonella enterica subsp. enterica]|nr:hypothetical protein KCP69_26515 [Salmonella enterica subsp. enterica]
MINITAGDTGGKQRRRVLLEMSATGLPPLCVSTRRPTTLLINWRTPTVVSLICKEKAAGSVAEQASAPVTG